MKPKTEIVPAGVNTNCEIVRWELVSRSLRPVWRWYRQKSLSEWQRNDRNHPLRRIPSVVSYCGPTATFDVLVVACFAGAACWQMEVPPSNISTTERTTPGNNRINRIKSPFAATLSAQDVVNGFDTCWQARAKDWQADMRNSGRIRLVFASPSTSSACVQSLK